MGMGKRTAEVVAGVIDAEGLAARKAAKKAKKAAAAPEAVAEQPMAVEEDAEAVALAEKKAAKKAKKAAAAAAAEEPAAQEDAEAAALAAKKAAKAAKKAAKAAAAEPAEEAMEEDAEAATLAAKKAAKKAKKAAAAPAAEKDEAAPAAQKEEAAPAAKKEEAAKDTPAGEEEWKDNTYKCIDCSEDWADTAEDQEWRFNQGFAEVPKRCKDCRWAKKVRMEGGDPTAKGKGKGKKGAGGDENTVFVRGLPFAATEESLNKDFGECGAIETLRMPLNEEGACKGFCFIKYADKEGMDKAMKFNETDYGGRTIYCSDAAIKPEGKGKGGKDGKGKDGKGKDGKGKGKKGKKGKDSQGGAFAKNTGAMVESTGTKVAFADSDDE